MIQAPNIEALIQQRVDVALANRFRCELASPANGQPMSTEERRRTLTILFTEIAKGMGGVWGAVERKTGLGACHCKMIGIQPNNEILPLANLKTDPAGFLITDEEMATSLAGVFAAGDIRSKQARQIINAAGEGAVAALSAERHLQQDIPLTSFSCHEEE